MLPISHPAAALLCYNSWLDQLKNKTTTQGKLQVTGTSMKTEKPNLLRTTFDLYKLFSAHLIRSIPSIKWSSTKPPRISSKMAKIIKSLNMSCMETIYKYSTNAKFSLGFKFIHCYLNIFHCMSPFRYPSKHACVWDKMKNRGLCYFGFITVVIKCLTFLVFIFCTPAMCFHLFSLSFITMFQNSFQPMTHMIFKILEMHLIYYPCLIYFRWNQCSI